MYSKRSLGLLELALSKSHHSKTPREVNQDSSPSRASSSAPSLTPSDENELNYVFQTEKQMCPILPMNALEKCAQWINTNNKAASAMTQSLDSIASAQAANHSCVVPENYIATASPCKVPCDVAGSSGTSRVSLSHNIQEHTIQCAEVSLEVNSTLAQKKITVAAPVEVAVNTYNSSEIKSAAAAPDSYGDTIHLTKVNSKLFTPPHEGIEAAHLVQVAGRTDVSSEGLALPDKQVQIIPSPHARMELITPQEHIAAALPLRVAGDNNMSSRRTPMSDLPDCVSNVRKNLFPANTCELEFSSFEELPGDLDGALILPLNEPVVLENVLRVEVVPDNGNECPSVAVEPETEENNNIQQVKKRKRPLIPTNKSPTKKRKTTPANWKRNKAKEANNAGVTHISTKGIEKRARIMKPPCSDKCRKNCRARVNFEIRQALFNKYWSYTQDKTSQWLFLSKLINITEIKRRKVLVEDDEEPWRKHSYEYHLRDLENNGDLIPVCQTMFLNTFDISSKVIKTALSKNSPDKRGKHSNRTRISPLLIESVKDHIKKYPVVQSHYCRADTQRMYLDENLSVSKMFRMYLLERGEDAPHTATERQFRDIFNSYFNLSFFKPKKDQCSLCLGFDAPGALKSQKEILEYNQHCEEKQKVREMKKRDKLQSKEDNSSIRVITFDLQKILYCPKGENAEFYYKRKLSCFNFTLYDCTARQAYCYVWDLTQGKKGANEVATFVLDYIEAMVKIGVNDFRIYSDSCTGQNKNKFLFCMYYLAAMKFQVKITHTWLVKGHTQMECDSVHARIEKKTKHLQIYTPSQWYGYIKSAKVKSPGYIVKEVNIDVIIKSFKPLEKYFKWEKVPISKLRSITIGSNDSGNVSYQTECEGVTTKYAVLAKNSGRPPNWVTFKLQKAYSGKLPLKPKVVNDLKWYVQKGFIPQAYLDFYVQLLEGPHDETLEDEDGDENDVPQEIVPLQGIDVMLDHSEDLDNPLSIGTPPDDNPEVATTHSASESDDDSDENDS